MSSGLACFRGTIWVITRSLGPIPGAKPGRHARLLARDDLGDVARGNRGQAVDVEHGLEDLVGLLGGDLPGREHADLALDGLVDDEVLLVSSLMNLMNARMSTCRSRW